MSSKKDNVTVVKIPNDQHVLVEKVRTLLLETPSKRTKEEQKSHFKNLFDTANELLRRDPNHSHYKELKAVSLFSFVDHCSVADPIAMVKLQEANDLAPNIKFIRDRLINLYIKNNTTVPKKLMDQSRLYDHGNNNNSNNNNNNNRNTNMNMNMNMDQSSQDKILALKLYASAVECEMKGDLQSAFRLLYAAHEKDKEHRDINLHIGRLYTKQGKITQANKHIDNAIRGKPVMWEAHMEKAGLEQKEGESSNAVRRLGYMVKSTDTTPEMKKRAMLLKIFYMNSLENSDNGKEIYDESISYFKLLNIKPYQFSEDQIKGFKRQSPIKIGYLSSHFKEHPIAYFMDGILEYHRSEMFQVHIFQIGQVEEDAYTARMKSYIHPDNWHVLRSDSCKLLADMIRSHNIAILSCLDVHTERDGEIASYRPAPIMVNYLGYPNTSGIDTIQYRITDSFADPQDTKQPWSEKLIRLPNSFLTFRASHLTVHPVSVAPCAKNGYVTFGCYNTLSKVQDPTWKCWKQILDRLPQARLIIKAPLFIEESAAQHYRDRLQKLGVDTSRVSLRAYSMDTQNHYVSYDEMDVSLDPFPYNGTTTSMDSLWMGVPFVTYAGTTHVHRVGASILNNVGLGDLVGYSTQEYVDIAVKLGQDLDRIKSIRSSLRDTLSKSILSDPKSFTIQLEDKYIEMFNQSLI
ncbi:glycosyltransferase [Cavenderia fasciculata]|uniref:Glycosyltransferase n=1 Tax=Cavenderia fasciculata TaxID=261658 RepID=F4PMJ8_CACFS|nr:glycosyltransferase [Cavenderia fasciculata]EGG23645.1 glycosyltransferase [Cavenderia fasciculata]|eukprot:XP_004361496.1 glycosyltransferase [Cavenderia fasciculata]